MTCKGVGLTAILDTDTWSSCTDTNVLLGFVPCTELWKTGHSLNLVQRLTYASEVHGHAALLGDVCPYFHAPHLWHHLRPKGCQWTPVANPTSIPSTAVMRGAGVIARS